MFNLVAPMWSGGGGFKDTLIGLSWISRAPCHTRWRGRWRLIADDARVTNIQPRDAGNGTLKSSSRQRLLSRPYRTYCAVRAATGLRARTPAGPARVTSRMFFETGTLNTHTRTRSTLASVSTLGGRRTFVRRRSTNRRVVRRRNRNNDNLTVVCV